MGKGSGSTQTTTSSNQPPQAVMDAYSDAYSKAQAAANQPYQAYPGQTVAPLTSQQEAAIGLSPTSAGNWNPYAARRKTTCLPRRSLYTTRYRNTSRPTQTMSSTRRRRNSTIRMRSSNRVSSATRFRRVHGAATDRLWRRVSSLVSSRWRRLPSSPD